MRRIGGESRSICLATHQLEKTLHLALYTTVVDSLLASEMSAVTLDEKRFFRKAALIMAKREDGTCLGPCEGRLFEREGPISEGVLWEHPRVGPEDR